MKLKRFAMKGLIVLAVVVALCMFFARTVQTITTPKVQIVTGSTGRFEQELKFTQPRWSSRKRKISSWRTRPRATL